ncbi:MAG: sulfur carrier protein ThiS adenylyltransferase ThiF [Desulfobacterales bacterium]|nr:sulfur carrier protein ThiS adenylyltransferase ThiF [Desulfobacterales bacterium]
MNFESAISRYLNEDQLKRIRSFTVGIAGAGGLGSNCANLLVRSGFKNFVIADFDIVDHSNLNRQFFFSDQLGMNKTEMLCKNLIKINRNIEIKQFSEKLNSKNIKSTFKNCNIIVEAFDDPFMKKTITEIYINSDKFIVAASGISGFNMFDKIKAKKIRDNFYLVGDGISEVSVDSPPVAPGVNIAASIQADIVLSHALGKL